MKLLVFSATGNSLYVAKRIQKEMDAEILSIPQLYHQKKWQIEDEVVGIVLPIYALEIPALVDEYLKQVQIKADYIFAVFTHALFAFETQALIHRYSFEVDATFQIKMPNNYLPVFDMKKTNQKKIKDISIHSILESIQTKMKHQRKSEIKFLLGNGIRKLNPPKFKEEDRKFTVSKKCTLCGVCKSVCVSNNITIENKVIFHHQCEQCLACIHLCPMKAIHHKSEKNDERYIHPEIESKEIIRLNQTEEI